MMPLVHSDGVPKKTLFVDIETTGNQAASPQKDRIIEIGAVDVDGNTVFNKLVNPGKPVDDTKTFIGIDDQLLQGKPTFEEVWPAFEATAFGCHLVFYNLKRDIEFFPRKLKDICHLSCCMTRFASVYGHYDHYHNSYKWQKLATAMTYIEGVWQGQKHRALSDADATRQVWNWMERKDDFGGASVQGSNVVAIARATNVVAGF